MANTDEVNATLRAAGYAPNERGDWVLPFGGGYRLSLRPVGAAFELCLYNGEAVIQSAPLVVTIVGGPEAAGR